MHIAFCTDCNYFMPCGVAMTSICENHRDENIEFHIALTYQENETHSTDVLESIARKYHKGINIYKIPAEKLKDFQCTGMQYISTSAFTRLLLADIVPSNVHKLIYFDCDIIVNGSLLPMWNTELPEDCAVAAVRDAFGGLAKQHVAIGTPISVPYVNSGVLLMNLDLWRNNNYSSKCAELARNKQYPLLDEDVLNDMFKEKIYLLPFQFNTQTHFFVNQNVNWAVDTTDIPALSEAIKEPVVIHYVSGIKPWNSDVCIRREVWQKYYDLSPWKDEKLGFSAKKQDEISLLLSRLGTLSKNEPELFVKIIQPSCLYYETACKMRHRKNFISFMSSVLSCATKLLDRIYRHNLRKLKK